MSDDTLYLYTSLTAGSSHIITATSRIETILKANKIPFKAIDCATDEKARMIWARRSKGKKIPGLVKYNDVVGDLEQIEEWNEYGELKDELESVIDIFGDVPVSATTAEAQAAAAARAAGITPAATGPSRSAAEQRHISISDPKDKDKETKKEDSPLSMAMRQAGAEAAAKAGQKKADNVAAIKAAATKDVTEQATPAPTAVEAAKLETAVADPDTENTGAKAPSLLKDEGVRKGSDVEEGKVGVDESASKSAEAQILEQRRKSSVPATSSSLAKQTSITEADTMPDPKGETEAKEPASKVAELEDRKEAEKPAEEDEDDDSEDEEDESDEDEETEAAATTSKVAASDKVEQKILGDTKPQEQEAKDADAASKSVAD